MFCKKIKNEKDTETINKIKQVSGKHSAVH